MFDKDKASLHFCEMLKYKTIAGNDSELTGFCNALETMYPLVHKICCHKSFGKGIMYYWKGKNSKESIVLMSHYDVVPAGGSQWIYPPFSGACIDGRFWGRGAIDTKCTLCAILESAEVLLSQGFVPDTDVYMCFGGDEETGGESAKQIAAELKKRNVKPFLILDEGGAVVSGKSVGINRPCALVGIAEKGYMDVEFITRGSGGHSSLGGGGNNPIVIMAEVIRRLERNIFKPVISKPVRAMIKSALKHANFKYRLIIRNYWFWGILFRKEFLKKRPEINALISNVGTITQISGGEAENVVAGQIRAVGNFRIVNGVNETLDIIRRALSDLDVEVNLLTGLEPSSVSDVVGKGWDMLDSVIKQIWKKSETIPYLMLARSDSRSYSEISDKIYRFSPITLNKDERKLIHGVNENISKEDFFKIIEFYIHLLSSLHTAQC